MSEIYCANCRHFEGGKCTCKGGLLYRVKISDAMAGAEHDCEKFEEVVYVLTEAGYLDLTLRDEGVELDPRTVKRVCDRFFERMMNAGMLKKGGES